MTSVHRRKLDFQRTPAPDPPVDIDGAVRVYLDEDGVLQAMDSNGTTIPIAGDPGGGSAAASSVTVADAAGQFAAANVEAALAELHDLIETLPTFD